MSIKSDKWIRRQCTPPSFMKKVVVPHAIMASCDVHLKPYMEWAPTHQTDDEILDEIRTFWDNPEVGTKDFRPLTKEEIKAFEPMISPFEPNLVRKHLIKQAHHHEGTFGLMAQPKDSRIIDADLYPESNAYKTEKVVSYGTSSYGYDIRCAPSFKVFTNINSTVVDPKNFDDKNYVDVHGDYCIIPPNSFALARTVEYFRIPRNVLAICLGKSTYARCGIIVNVTPLEPEWEGYLTLEFSNTTPLPAKVYAGEGCAQLLFFESDEDCETSYKDRGGKYQNQVDQPVPPKV